MPESHDISARLTALETVVSQLITHLAVRADDPAGWVETRKVLALNAINYGEDRNPDRLMRLHDAVLGFFNQAEAVVSEYSGRPGRYHPTPVRSHADAGNPAGTRGAVPR